MLPITSKLEALRTRGHYDTHQPDFSALVEDFPELSAVVTHKNRHRDARGDDADVGPRGKHPRSHARGAGAGDSSDEEAMDDSRSDSYTTGCAGNAARTWLDFSDPRAATLLSRALLRTDFELSIDVPRGNLCPVVPRSLNYLHFTRRIMEAALATQLAASGYEPDGSALPHAGVTFSHGLDCEQPATRALLVAASALLDAGADSAACHTDPAAYPVAAADANSSSSSSSSSAPAPRFPPLLLDVGTGATAVFLLLARRLYGYGGVGIDVDPRSCLSAAGNAARNTAAPAILTTNPGAPAADSGGPAADPAATAGRAVAIVHSHDRASVLAPVLPQFPAAVPPVPELSQATAPTSAWSVRQAREPTRQAPAEPADGSAEVSAGARVAAVLYPLLRRPFALTVCNPPFFNASAPADVAAAVVAAAEAAASTAVTVDVPDSASSGAADKQYFSVPRNPTREWAATGSELACPGGEVAFVSQVGAPHEARITLCTVYPLFHFLCAPCLLF
jgi:23S rRNA A1618 N6-methylase RlmF